MEDLDSDHGSTPQEHELSDDWQAARHYAFSFQPFSNLFTHFIRAAQSELQQGTKPLSSPTHQQFARLYRSASVRAILYYALITLDEAPVKKREYVRDSDIYSLISPSDLTALLAIIYLFRRGRTLTKRYEESERILQNAQLYADLSLYLGSAIPDLGISACLFGGPLRNLIFLSYLNANRKVFKQYWVDIKRRKVPFDLKMEMEMFRCTHLQVSAVVLQKVGFGAERGKSFIAGVEAKSHKELKGDALRYMAGLKWLDALILTGGAPDATIGDEFMLEEHAANRLEPQIDKLLRDGSAYSWLFKGKKDLNPSRTPQVYFFDLDAKPESPAEDQIDDEE